MTSSITGFWSREILRQTRNRWSLRRAVLFVTGTSAAIWSGLTMAVVAVAPG